MPDQARHDSFLWPDTVRHGVLHLGVYKDREMNKHRTEHEHQQELDDAANE